MKKTIKSLEERLQIIRQEWGEDIVVSLIVTADGVITLKNCTTIEYSGEDPDSNVDNDSDLNLSSPKINSPFLEAKQDYMG